MSALIFYTSATEIILAMDTLAVSDQDGTPLLFTTKFYPIPHLCGVICGTGLGQFVIDWFVEVNTRMVVDDIPHLDYHAPGRLRELWLTRYKELSPISTVTVYHFGFDGNDTPCAFAYRSEKDFNSEQLLIGGIATKPPTAVPCDFKLPEDFKKMMLSQQAEESAKPRGDRVYIGGDVLVCHMTKGGTAIYQAGIFPDRDQTRDTIYAGVSG